MPLKSLKLLQNLKLVFVIVNERLTAVFDFKLTFSYIF